MVLLTNADRGVLTAAAAAAVMSSLIDVDSGALATAAVVAATARTAKTVATERTVN